MHGSEDALAALTSGIVRIADIPDDYWTPRAAGERVKFLEEAYERANRDKKPMGF